MPKHEDILKQDAWSHLRIGSWVGGISGASRQVIEGANIPTVHLLRAGSNTCISGFRDPAEARDFRASSEMSSDWHVVDLREDRPRHTRSTLEVARRQQIESIFEEAEFSSDVEDVSGWEFDGEDTFRRPVFLSNPGGDSLRVDFSVSFRPRTSEDWEVDIIEIASPDNDTMLSF